jgi:hypothetical protein
MFRRFNLSVLFCGLILIFSKTAFSQVELDIETGAVFSGYNDVRIPGQGGTGFSLSDELEADPKLYYRLRAIYRFTERHHAGLLVAPLSIDSKGKLNRDLVFQGQTFPQNTPLKTTFQFNSYRLFYRYGLVRKEHLKFDLGITAKIRDAKISVSGQGIESKKTNVGFVPLIHFSLLWDISNQFAFLLEGDALAAPQGRAEDVLAALVTNINDELKVKLGYRILEGGADNDTVYNFTLFHYLALGLTYSF